MLFGLSYGGFVLVLLGLLGDLSCFSWQIMPLDWIRVLDGVKSLF